MSTTPQKNTLQRARQGHPERHCSPHEPALAGTGNYCPGNPTGQFAACFAGIYPCPGPDRFSSLRQKKVSRAFL